MTWLLRLMGILDVTTDRVSAAGERIASAAETMAADWEAALTLHRERFAGLDTEPPTSRRKLTAK